MNVYDMRAQGTCARTWYMREVDPGSASSSSVGNSARAPSVPLFELEVEGEEAPTEPKRKMRKPMSARTA